MDDFGQVRYSSDGPHDVYEGFDPAECHTLPSTGSRRLPAGTRLLLSSGSTHRRTRTPVTAVEATPTVARTTSAPDRAGNSGESRSKRPGRWDRSPAVRPGQRPNQPKMIAASRAESSGTVVTGRPSPLAPVDGSGSVAEASEGAARHTRAWPAGAPASVADCRRLRFVPLSCQMQRSATVNKDVWRSSCWASHQSSKPQVAGAIPSCRCRFGFLTSGAGPIMGSWCQALSFSTPISCGPATTTCGAGCGSS